MEIIGVAEKYVCTNQNCGAVKIQEYWNNCTLKSKTITKCNKGCGKHRWSLIERSIKDR